MDNKNTQNKKQTKPKKVQSVKNNKVPKQKKLTNKDRAWFSDMNQIDWYPVDPYAD